jgi:hypothetical protein
VDYVDEAIDDGLQHAFTLLRCAEGWVAMDTNPRAFIHALKMRHEFTIG